MPVHPLHEDDVQQTTFGARWMLFVREFGHRRHLGQQDQYRSGQPDRLQGKPGLYSGPEFVVSLVDCGDDGQVFTLVVQQEFKAADVTAVPDAGSGPRFQLVMHDG